MGGRIQAQPRGLLAALGLIGTGEQPTELADAVVPTYDVRGFYNVDATTTVQTAGNVQNVGDVLTLSVPEGELWLIRALAGTCAILTGEQVRINCGIRPPGGAANVRLTNNLDAFAAGALTQAVASVYLGDGVLVRAGWSLVLTVDLSTLAAPRAAFLQALATVYRSL